MSKNRYDIIVIGSGAGGATLAKELTKAGMKVLVIEKGRHYDHVGNIRDIVKFHDATSSTKQARFTEEGMMLLRTYMAGGSTVVSCGNGVRCLEEELGSFGIHLEEEFREAERELRISTLPRESLSEGSRAILTASHRLGYSMEFMPKFVRTGNCSQCGECYAGCQNEAKWTALDYLEEAEKKGAEIMYDTAVSEIIIRDGKATGVITNKGQGQRKIYAGKVILSAGGLSSPIILNNSGFSHAGSGLFVDTFVNVYGKAEGLNQKNECPMALVDLGFYRNEGFILSTFMNSIKLSLFAELGTKALSANPDKLIGVMVKIRDERSGRVHHDGRISKPLTDQDQVKLTRGIDLAKKILAKAGADEKSFMVSILQGAHPGGTAAIGELVDEKLRTNVKDLYICDGSILPVSPGLPPIVTLVALAKYLSKTLV